MNEPIEELKTIASDLATFVESFQSSEFIKALEGLRDAANEVGKAWSGSWLGYQARVYYNGLVSPPPGCHFSSEWGLRDFYSETTGEWLEYKVGVIEGEIHRRAGNQNLSKAQESAEAGISLFNEKKETLISILQALSGYSTDSYLLKLLQEANDAMVITRNDFINQVGLRGERMTRDALAASQGIWIPPHISVLGDIADIQGPAAACKELATVARKTFSYLERVQNRSRRDARIGTNVFIGHGGSKSWRELKDFVKDRLHLPVDEFNRVPVAGITNIARLSEMLEAAAIALIVMTAEDEQPDGKVRARMNVIHEVGLFQGRLGFTRALVLLEEGCEEFSNIEGLGQIRFPKGNIAACFEDVRKVLEREKLIEEK